MILNDNTFDSITKDLQSICEQYHSCNINHVSYMHNVDDIYVRYNVLKKDYIETLNKKLGKISKEEIKSTKKVTKKK